MRRRRSRKGKVGGGGAGGGGMGMANEGVDGLKDAVAVGDGEERAQHLVLNFVCHFGELSGVSYGIKICVCARRRVPGERRGGKETSAPLLSSSLCAWA